MECDQKVDTQKVRDLSRKVMLRFADHYPWVEIQDTTHELYAHLAFKLQQNGDRGLKALSEESLEAMHKVVDNTLEHLSRQTSFVDSLTDIITRCNVRSDPMVRVHEPKVSCSNCEGEGHTERSCVYKLDPQNEDDNMLQEIILTYHQA